MIVYPFDDVAGTEGLCPFVVVELSAADVTGATHVSLWRDDGTGWSLVRGAVRVPVSGGWTGTDHECGFNRSTAYRVERFDSFGTSLGFGVPVSVVLSSVKTWVHNVLAATHGVAVSMVGSAYGVLDRPHETDVLFPRGRPLGVSVGTGRRGLQGLNLSLYTETLEQADKVQALLGTEVNPLPPHLVVRKGSAEGSARIPHTLHVHVPSIIEVPFDVRLGGETVQHELSGTQASPPSVKLSTPVLTRADIAARYATRAARSADNLTRAATARRWDLSGAAG